MFAQGYAKVFKFWGTLKIQPQARGKSSQLGRKEPPPPKKVVSISLSQDVKLHKSEDAWRPTHKSSGAEDPEKEKTDVSETPIM